MAKYKEKFRGEVLANMGVAGYDDFTNVHHAGPFANALVKEVSLPALPFSIAMPALSLLLVFRTNTAYFRSRSYWNGAQGAGVQLHPNRNFAAGVFGFRTLL